jgi:haloalkane dehalogenase
MTVTAGQVPAFTEHRIAQGQGNLYVRDYAGSGPAFVLLHGFPDNSHIYDDLIPYLVAAGRRTVAFDFLGFRASDKPEGATYSFEQQLGDLRAVADALRLDKIIPVAHDAGGPAVNYAIENPQRTAAVCLLNVFYANAPGLRFPEFIELFATKSLKALTRHILQNPQQFAALLAFQRGQMQAGMSERQKAHYNNFLGPLIENNFTQKPSAGPAFAQMTFRANDEVAANDGRLDDLRRLNVPVNLIWGKADDYLSVGVAEDLRTHAKIASLHLIQAGHWPQIDEPAEVARIMIESR